MPLRCGPLDRSVSLNMLCHDSFTITIKVSTNHLSRYDQVTVRITRFLVTDSPISFPCAAGVAFPALAARQGGICVRDVCCISNGLVKCVPRQLRFKAWRLIQSSHHYASMVRSTCGTCFEVLDTQNFAVSNLA
jgi:hypothetical protein